LYGKEAWLNKLPPSSSMKWLKRSSKTTYAELPHKFEAEPKYCRWNCSWAPLSITWTPLVLKIFNNKNCNYWNTEPNAIGNWRFENFWYLKRKTSVRLTLQAFIHTINKFIDKLGIVVRTGHHCANRLWLIIPGTTMSFIFSLQYQRRNWCYGWSGKKSNTADSNYLGWEYLYYYWLFSEKVMNKKQDLESAVIEYTANTRGFYQK
jgi:hypothetical protein